MSEALQRRLERVLGPHVTGIATRRQDFLSAYQLVYRRYVECGFAAPNPAGLIYHDTFALPSSRTITTVYRGETLGTVTVVGDGNLGLQLESIYPHEVARLRRQRRSLAELTCLAIRPDTVERRGGAFFALTRFMYQYARWRQFDDLLLAVHPRHVRFYERWFRVFRFGPCRPYQRVQGQPAIACRVDLRRVKDSMSAVVYRWYNDPCISVTDFQRPQMSPADHTYFCDRARPAAAARAA